MIDPEEKEAKRRLRVIFARYMPKRSGKRLTKKDKHTILQRFKSGWKISAIALAMGISIKTITALIKAEKEPKQG